MNTIQISEENKKKAQKSLEASQKLIKELGVKNTEVVLIPTTFAVVYKVNGKLVDVDQTPIFDSIIKEESNTK